MSDMKLHQRSPVGAFLSGAVRMLDPFGAFYEPPRPRTAPAGINWNTGLRALTESRNKAIDEWSAARDSLVANLLPHVGGMSSDLPSMWREIQEEATIAAAQRLAAALPPKTLGRVAAARGVLAEALPKAMAAALAQRSAGDRVAA